MWGATEGVFHSASSPTNHLLLTVVERRDFRASRRFCLSDAKSATDIVGTDNTGAPPFDGPHHFERERQIFCSVQICPFLQARGAVGAGRRGRVPDRPFYVEIIRNPESASRPGAGSSSLRRRLGSPNALPWTKARTEFSYCWRGEK